MLTVRHHEVVPDAARRADDPVRTCRSTLQRGDAVAIIGSVGQRQEHAALHPRRTRPANLRLGDARRHQSVRARRTRTGGVSQRAHRVRLPGSLAAAAVLGTRERPGADAGRGAGRSAMRRRPSARARDSRAGRAVGSARPSAGRAVGRREAARGARPGADPRPDRCCSATSRPATSIAPSADAVAALLLELHASRRRYARRRDAQRALADAFPRRYEMNAARWQAHGLVTRADSSSGRACCYYWRTNLAVVLGVAAAVSVLAGALLVGDSVRGSLRDIAVGRLGQTDFVVVVDRLLSRGARRDLQRIRRRPRGSRRSSSPAEFVTHEASGRRAPNVLVYGVDERFWSLPRASRPHAASFFSPALAAELGAHAGRRTA